MSGTKYSYHFAEVCTSDGISEWLCLQNPSSNALATTCMLVGGMPVEKTCTLKATSRTSINVNDEVGSGQDVPVKVVTEGEFYAERPIYESLAAG